MPVASIVPDSTPADFGEHPVGTGPWKFVEWKHDDYLMFARNENYWGGAPATDSLIARIIPEPSTAVAEFESGNVDMLVIPQGETRGVGADGREEGDAAERTGAAFCTTSAINTTRGPLTDARVRQAINHAVDTKTILEQLMGGRGFLARGVVSPILDGADTIAHSLCIRRREGEAAARRGRPSERHRRRALALAGRDDRAARRRPFRDTSTPRASARSSCSAMRRRRARRRAKARRT